MKKMLVICGLASVLSPAFAQTSSSTNALPSDLLSSWIDLHCHILKNAKGIAHIAYSRHFTYTSIACYESVVGSDATYRSLAGQLTGLEALPRPTSTNQYWAASMNAAYAEMLRYFYAAFPSCVSAADSMEKMERQIFLKNGASQNNVDQSAGYGRAIAAAVIKWAQEDGSKSTKQYMPVKAEGVWFPESQAAEPFWCESRSMIKNLSSVYRLKAPVYSKDPASDFYKMANDVYQTSVHLTPEQKATGWYWDDSPNGKYMSAFGHWASILSGIIRQKQLSLMQATEAYAKMTITVYEATILAWKGKYQYNILRPISYIQQNIDKQWVPLISTPPHPEFPAAHATFSNAAATALTTLFGDNCTFTDRSYTDIGMKERTYTNIQQAAKEAGMSRLYGGIHYRYSIEQGFILGEDVAKLVSRSISFH